MVLEEFLIKIGVDASRAGDISRVVNKLQTGANQLANAADGIQTNAKRAIQEAARSVDAAGGAADSTKSKFSGLKLGIAGLIAVSILYGKKLVSAFSSAMDGVTGLSREKHALFKISQREINQADLYQREMRRTGLALDSIKTKIALNLAPAITNVVSGFRNWLTVNKELVTNGITKIVRSVGSVIQVVINTIRFIDKIVTSTVGWKNAITALSVVWAVFNRALLFSPIGIVMGLITGLMLLIDDLMVYMNGGKSLFGGYWQPLIDGAKAAWTFLQTFWQFLTALWSGDTQTIKSLSKKLFDSLINGFKSLIRGVKSLLSNLLKNILVFFGMSESGASKTVDRIGKIFNFIIDAITFPFRMAYRAICAILDWLGIDAGDVVNAIGGTFKAIWDFVTAPFKAAWKFVNDLFDIWEDDTSSTTDKLGKTLWAIWDFVTAPFKAAWNFVKSLFTSWVGDSGETTKKLAEKFLSIHNAITAPFKKAIDWIKEKFFGFIDTVKNSVKSALSWTGWFDDDDDNVEVTQKTVTESQIQTKLSTDLARAGRVVPVNKNVNNNNEVTINNTMHVDTPQEGFDQVYNIVDNVARRINDNTVTAMGSN